MEQSSGIVLTIGIPTYNGEATITDCIESCLRSVDIAGRRDVEILVVDNFSSDTTCEAVTRIQRKARVPIQLLRNQENIGLDRNIDEVIKNARGKYVKLLGDDDLLGDFFVERFFTVIDSIEFDIMLSAFELLSENKTESVVRDSQVVVFQKTLDIVLRSNGIVGQIASIVFDRESYLRVNAESANDTNHKFLFVAMVLFARGTSLYDSKPSLLVRPGSPRFTGNARSSLVGQLKAVSALCAIRDFGGPWTTNQKKILGELILSQKQYSLSFMDYVHRYSDMNSIQVIREFFPLGKSIPSFYYRYVLTVLIPKKWGNFLAQILKGLR